MKAVLPFVETVERVKKSTTNIKKSLFSPAEIHTSTPYRKIRRKRGLASKLSNKIRLSRTYIFNQKAPKTNYSQEIASKKSLIIMFLKRPEHSVELPSKRDCGK